MPSELDISVEGARTAQQRGEIAEWVERFLSSDGSDNRVLGEVLHERTAIWHGPVQLPFDRLNRLAGPPDQPALERLDHDDIETVDAMAGSIYDGWDPPPLIVSFVHGDLNVEDGNHRIEGLRRSGRDRYWAIIAFDDEQQRRSFLEQTG